MGTGGPNSSSGADRTADVRALIEDLDRMASSARHIPEEEMDALIEEAVRHVRHRRSWCASSLTATFWCVPLGKLTDWRAYYFEPSSRDCIAWLFRHSFSERWRVAPRQAGL
jgi:hypothetical protein